ncbi:MAG: methyltransferase domain-containing protein [Acidimicrobiia bacterium]
MDTESSVIVNRTDLRIQVMKKYREVAGNPAAGYHFFTGRKAADHVGYSADLLEALPPEVIEAFAGVANPFHWGTPPFGATVVDIGSGAGLDSVIAARSVGPEGRVIGIDMTPEMLDRAQASAEALGLIQLEFRKGLAEELPVADASVDIVISNGVLNLVPDKLGAYSEIRRVLKPQGEFRIADIVVEKPVPEGAQRDIDLWTG